jgi:hypothetical protein
VWYKELRINIMVDTQYNIAEFQYDQFEKYLASKRVNIAPMLGTNVCLSTVTLSLTEAPSPYEGGFELRTSDRTIPSETYMADIALAEVVQLDSRRQNTVNAAIRAQEAA